MANASLILEIALLLLVAFLAGCVLGSLARRLTLRRPQTAAAARPAEPASPGAAATPLVATPQVAPLLRRSPGPSPEQRLRAAAGKSPVPPPPEVEHNPPPVEPPAPAPRIERRPARTAGEIATALPPAEPPAPAESDPEAAARQAVEGGWTPPRRRSPAPFPVAAATPDLPAEAAPGDLADAAVADARSAVIAALAAADAALAAAPPNEPQPASPRRRFGAPPRLDAPRSGGRDDLTAIRGITPAMQESLNGLGIFHYDQIAGWDGKAAVWIDGQLGLRGRIVREKWPELARRLAAGPRPVRARR